MNSSCFSSLSYSFIFQLTDSVLMRHTGNSPGSLPAAMRLCSMILILCGGHLPTSGHVPLRLSIITRSYCQLLANVSHRGEMIRRTENQRGTCFKLRHIQTMLACTPYYSFIDAAHASVALAVEQRQEPSTQLHSSTANKGYGRLPKGPGKRRPLKSYQSLHETPGRAVNINTHSLTL